MSGLLFGLMVYLNSVVTLNGAIYSRILGAPGNLTFAIWFQVWRIRCSRSNKGTQSIKQISLLFDESSGKFELLRLFAVVVEGLFSVINLALVMATLQFAFYADINQGVITCIFASESFFVGLLTYVFQGERLNVYQFAGMFFMLLSVISMGLSDLVNSPGDSFVEPS